MKCSHYTLYYLESTESAELACAWFVVEIISCSCLTALPVYSACTYHFRGPRTHQQQHELTVVAAATKTYDVVVVRFYGTPQASKPPLRTRCIANDRATRGKTTDGGAGGPRTYTGPEPAAAPPRTARGPGDNASTRSDEARTYLLTYLSMDLQSSLEPTKITPPTEGKTR